jgi:hypothetical protein
LGPQDETRQHLDPVRPGEQWFCYWKTSAALWETRIQEFAPGEIIFIPLHWGFHAENEQEWDFGKYHPERDLKRLVHVLMQHGRKFCWLLPLTPAPFLPNGGIPISAARSLSVAQGGMHLACLDQDQTLYKMYSFFDPKVFQAFAGFVSALGETLAELQCRAPIWGAEFFFQEEEKLVSFLEDQSPAFDQGFSRYLKKNHPQGIDLTQTQVESRIKQSFLEDVSSLFTSLAQDALAPFWRGKKDIVVFGAGPKDTIERALGQGKSQTNYFHSLFESFVHQRWFSTCLLTVQEKRDLLRRCLREHFGNEELLHRFGYLSEASEPGPDFRPYCLIDVFDLKSPQVFRRNGLKQFLSTHFRWMYYQHDNLEFTPEWIDGSHHRLKFFHAQTMDRTLFAQALKLFMMGQKVVIDRAGLSEDLDKRLQIFFLENNLKLQSVNFLTSVTLSELGEGRLILFDGSKLSGAQEQEKFWSQLFRFFHLIHPKIDADSDIFSFWRIRATSPHELNYLDVRRVNFYNPTSYKKSVTVQTQKKFAFMKVIDPLNASAKTTPEGVEVELLPNGKLALDFGHYEENA